MIRETSIPEQKLQKFIQKKKGDDNMINDEWLKNLIKEHYFFKQMVNYFWIF